MTPAELLNDRASPYKRKEDLKETLIVGDIDKDTWNRVLSNSGRYIREARGKFIQ